MQIKDKLLSAAQLHKGTELGDLLDQALGVIVQLSDGMAVAIKNGNAALSRMDSLAMALHSVTTEMGLLVALHSQGKALDVHKRLCELDMRISAFQGGRTLQEKAQAAGQVH
jgi:hypothetical protein